MVARTFEIQAYVRLMSYPPLFVSICNVVVILQQVDEQINELYIHCKYGCRPSPCGIPGEYEYNPEGKVQPISSFHFTLHLSMNLFMLFGTKKILSVLRNFGMASGIYRLLHVHPIPEWISQ